MSDEYKKNFDKDNIIRPKMVSIKVLNKAKNSICKITIKIDYNIQWSGTGFFMSFNIGDSKPINFLINAFHVISPHIIGSKKAIKISIEEIKEINIELKIKNRLIKCFQEPIGITIIQILDSDELQNNIDFTSYDFKLFEKWI